MISSNMVKLLRSALGKIVVLSM